jgi:hypothetical protein
MEEKNINKNNNIVSKGKNAEKNKLKRLKKKNNKLVYANELSELENEYLTKNEYPGDRSKLRSINYTPLMKRNLGLENPSANYSYLVDKNDVAKHTKEITAMNTELNKLKVQFAQFHAAVTTGRSPLSNVGSQLTGRIAKVIQMFVNPEDSDALPIPGNDPASILKMKMIPRRSLSLTAGKTRVIATPFGQYQFFASRGIGVTSNPATTTQAVAGIGYNAPVWTRLWEGASGQEVNVMTLSGNPNSVNGGTAIVTVGYDTDINFQTTMYSDVLAGPAYQTGFQVLEIDDALNNSNLIINYNSTVPPGVAVPQAPITLSLSTSSVAISGLTEAEFAALNPNFVGQYIQLLPAPVLGAVGPTMYNITDYHISTPADQGVVFSRIQFRFGALAGAPQPSTLTFANGVDSYDAVQFPTLASIGAGDLLGKSQFLAMSLLLGNDSAALNDNGFIFGASLTEDVRPPAGQTLEDWISNKTKWSYNGKLKTGGYQVYVPSISQQANYQNQFVSPFFSPAEFQAYNMVWIIDNSVTPNGGAPPDYLQAHTTLAAVYASAKIDTFIPMSVYPKDPGYELALSYLRHYYIPCCNPDHKEQIKLWLKNTFKSVISHGQDIISEYGPELVDGTARILKTALPLVISGLGMLA